MLAEAAVCARMLVCLEEQHDQARKLPAQHEAAPVGVYPVRRVCRLREVHDVRLSEPAQHVKESTPPARR